jgi:hypothetical protein
VTTDRLSIRRAIDAYIWLIETPDLAADRRLEALPAALDRLAAAVHEAEYTFDEVDYPDAPRVDYKAVYSLVGNHFPDLGYYNVAHPGTQRIADASILVGDSIDDIADILLDVKEVVWCWEHTSVDDALWHLKESLPNPLGFAYAIPSVLPARAVIWARRELREAGMAQPRILIPDSSL